MAGVRTAPTVSGSPTFKVVSLSWMDWTGEPRTDSYQFDAAATAAQIETFAAAVQLISNATLYRIQVKDTYNSQPSKQNADESVWEEASSNVVVLLKDLQNNSMDLYTPAPVNTIFLEGTENVDATNADFLAWVNAANAMKANYSAISVRFSSRRDIGTKTNI